MAAKGQLDTNATEDSKRQRKYNSSPEQKKRRAQRNKSRKLMMDKGSASKGDGKDVDHNDKNTANNTNNLSMKSKKANRADNRGTGGAPKGNTNAKK